MNQGGCTWVGKLFSKSPLFAIGLTSGQTGVAVALTVEVASDVRYVQRSLDLTRELTTLEDVSWVRSSENKGRQ